MFSKKGFTLVELLVVVAILGILAAVGIVSFGGFLGSAKENATKTNFNSVMKYIEMELLKCDMGLELEAYEKFESNRQKYSGLVLTSCETYFGDPYKNNTQKFEAISSQIINYLHGYSGIEKGFNNPYGNDEGFVKNSGINVSYSCPPVERIGYIYCNLRTGNIKCCTRINKDETIEKIFSNPYE